MKKLGIEFTLSSPLILGQGFLTLDAVLAYANEFYNPTNHVAAIEQLPLKRTEGIWHASAVQLDVNTVVDNESFLMSLRGESDHNTDAFLPNTRRDYRKINQKRRPWKTHLDQVVTYHAPCVRFFCVGDAERISTLLSVLPGLGKKVAHGNGEIDAITITEADEDYSWCGPEGQVMRPVPKTVWEKAGLPVTEEMVWDRVAVTNPYWSSDPEDAWVPYNLVQAEEEFVAIEEF